MSNLIVVGKLPDEVYLTCVNGYRGVQRMDINYPFEFYKTGHPIEVINAEYEILTETDPALHDIAFARKLRDFYNETFPSVDREIIEIVFDTFEPEYGKELLGFDIADLEYGYSNILNIILATCRLNKQKRTFDELDLICHELLITLNQYELFKTMNDAKYAQDKIETYLTKENRMAAHHKYYSVGIWTVE